MNIFLWKLHMFNILFFPILTVLLVTNIFILILILNIHLSFYLILFTTTIISLFISFYTKTETVILTDFFYSKEPILFSILFIWLVLIGLFIIAFWIPRWSGFFYIHDFFPFIKYWIIPLLFAFLFFFNYTSVLFRLNYVWIILMPITLLWALIYGFFVFVKYSIQWIWLWRVIKYSPQSKILVNFSKLEKRYAENEYYKIELK